MHAGYLAILPLLGRVSLETLWLAFEASITSQQQAVAVVCWCLLSSRAECAQSALNKRVFTPPRFVAASCTFTVLFSTYWNVKYSCLWFHTMQIDVLDESEIKRTRSLCSVLKVREMHYGMFYSPERFRLRNALRFAVGVNSSPCYSLH